MSRVIYENGHNNESDINNLILEGSSEISFANIAMIIKSEEEAVMRCTKSLPADVRIDWEFKAVGDISANDLYFAVKKWRDYVISFFLLERMTPEERAFHTFSLYKNSFENLVYKGADTMQQLRRVSCMRCLLLRGEKTFSME